MQYLQAIMLKLIIKMWILFVLSFTESYKKSFSDQGDILVLNPDSEFFRYFNPAN